MWRNLFILYFVFVKKQRTIERKKKRSKISGLESCYANRIYVLIGVELRPYGQKLVQFCKHTHTHARARVSFSSIDYHQWKVILFCIIRVRLCRHSLHTPKKLHASTERMTERMGGGDAQPKRKPPMTVRDIVRVRLCYVFFTPIIVRILCAFRRLRVEFYSILVSLRY